MFKINITEDNSDNFDIQINQITTPKGCKDYWDNQ